MSESGVDGVSARHLVEVDLKQEIIPSSKIQQEMVRRVRTPPKLNSATLNNVLVNVLLPSYQIKCAEKSLFRTGGGGKSLPKFLD